MSVMKKVLIVAGAIALTAIFNVAANAVEIGTSKISCAMMKGTLTDDAATGDVYCCLPSGQCVWCEDCIIEDVIIFPKKNGQQDLKAKQPKRERKLKRQQNRQSKTSESQKIHGEKW